MTVLTEKLGPGSCIIQEGEHFYSRDVVTVNAGVGVTYPANTVLGRIALGSISAAAKSGGNAANTGALTLDETTPILAGAQLGVYRVRCVAVASNGGTFRVEDPNGYVLGDVAVGATFSDQIKFSIADGSQDFILGEGFDITVGAGSGKYVIWNPANLDGSQVVAAILVYPVTGEQEATVLRRHAQVKSPALNWFTGATDNNKLAGIAGLAALGIIAR